MRASKSHKAIEIESNFYQAECIAKIEKNLVDVWRKVEQGILSEDDFVELEVENFDKEWRENGVDTPKISLTVRALRSMPTAPEIFQYYQEFLHEYVAERRIEMELDKEEGIESKGVLLH